MTKKISKRVREQAAHLCAVQASTPWWQGWPRMLGMELGFRMKASSLAVEAWLASPIDADNSYAHAESMLRTGWSPS